MTNLRLPDMSFKNLSKLAPSNGEWKKVAYATFARNVLVGRGMVEVRHFDTVIATIYDSGVDLNNVSPDNEVFHSKTTSMRMNRIIRDNGVTDKWVVFRKGNMFVVDRDDKKVGDIPTFIRTI